ncbi:MAG: rod shape-determining protein MreC [Lachnospiraceae bacterium]|nr:rod shape-determining protein MreC [Lachnospiraceae bacterium]MBD5497903.1 rod shape-determining protein MreC [Lachnospiraceae bacterium]MBD5510348.1 rod shape-determining protein MreC [Lachnospiraceae bacterium]
MSPIIKKKGERFTIPGKYLLFILTVLCTAMMLITFSTDIFNKPLNTIVGYVIVPFQKGLSSVGSWLSARSDELVQIRALLEENEELKRQVAELTLENTQLQQGWYELNTLRDLYKLDGQYEEYDKIGARIIARDTGNWYHSFTIDKGEEDGLAVDMNVIAGGDNGGLVGRIVSVGPNWAKVTSIISDNSNVTGQMLATGDMLIVSGDLSMMQNGMIRFSQLLDSAGVVVTGDKIVTSDISDKYLPGILIGYIGEINLDSNKLTKSGSVTPAVDFEHLDEVLVILELKQTVSE